MPSLFHIWIFIIKIFLPAESNIQPE